MERTSQLVYIGDVITMPRGDEVVTLKVAFIPQSRVNAARAIECYERL
jgi:ribosomal 50S subunit-recycling heat shock protein